MKKNNLLLTGGSGFIGAELIHRLSHDGFSVIAPTRGRSLINSVNITSPHLNDIEDLIFHTEFFHECDVVIHVAAKSHSQGSSVEEIRRINTSITLAIAEAAAKAGVRRFIFLSSVKVNGESTEINSPFKFDDIPAPADSYGISKLEAERGLLEIAKRTSMDVVIIRPPLVYGPGVKANFLAMLKLAKKNLPLPLGAIYNKRSLVPVENLVDLVVTCIDHPAAANQTFLVSDDCNVSTTELLKLMTFAFGKKPILLPIPVSWLKVVATLAGKQAVFDRLCGNLQVDISHTKQTLGWKPPITLEQGIAKCIAASKVV